VNGMMPPIPTLRTARLRLRGWCEADLDHVARLNADPEVARFKHAPQDRAESWRGLAIHLGHWALRGHGMWLAELAADGRFAGWVGLYQPEGWPDLEVGWTIDPALWGRGLATEGGGAALDWAAAKLGRCDPISVMPPDNAASIRVAAKLGAHFERRAVVRGVDVLIYSHDWRGGTAPGPSGR
jgi:RimJ/RimL family protein N-acetyltransferase